MTTAWDAIHEIYEGRAHKRYGLTSISQTQHALQSAAIAQQNGGNADLIIAALLHDVGHMVHDLGEAPADAGVDDRHEILGADWLAQYFGPQISEPVRLHVQAKRYLCAVEPHYIDRLLDDSILSLTLQGGPMSPAEATAFGAQPYADAAIALRRIDEAAKNPEAMPPPLTAWQALITAAAKM